VPQYFVPVRGSQPAGQTLFYQPEIVGAATIHFTNVKAGVNTIKDVLYRMTVTEGPVAIDWDSAAETTFKASEMEMSPREPAQWGGLPPIAAKSDSYGFWSKEFATWLVRSQKVDLWKSPALKEFSRPGETERDFRVRIQQQSRETRDEAADKLRQKYAPKIATLQERMRRAQATVEKEKDQARHQKVQTALSFGGTLLGGFLGRKTTSGAKSTISGMSRASKESRDIGRAKDTVEAIQEQLQQLDADFKADMAALAARMDPQTEQLEQVPVRPAKKDISVTLLALGWLPYWRTPAGELTQAW
jgi:hypothetical protein